MKDRGRVRNRATRLKSQGPYTNTVAAAINILIYGTSRAVQYTTVQWSTLSWKRSSWFDQKIASQKNTSIFSLALETLWLIVQIMVERTLTSTVSSLFLEFSKLMDDQVILFHSKGLRWGIEVENCRDHYFKDINRETEWIMWLLYSPSFLSLRRLMGPNKTAKGSW